MSEDRPSEEPDGTSPIPYAEQHEDATRAVDTSGWFAAPGGATAAAAPSTPSAPSGDAQPGQPYPSFGPSAYGQQPYAQQPDAQPYGQQVDAPPAYAGPPGYPQPGGYGQPPQPGQPYPAYGAQPSFGGGGTLGKPYGATSSKATTVLVLGIVSIPALAFCGTGFIAAIVALVLAPGAKREIRGSGGALSGEGQVKAGRILSVIALVLGVLGIIGYIGIIAYAASHSSPADSPIFPSDSSFN